jgi:indole-3-glycerol phosphate synthase
MNILQEISQRTKKRVESQKKTLPLEKIMEEIIKCQHNNNGFPFEKALQNPQKTNDIAFICEVKRASPSKGIIAEDFPYLEIAKDYQDSGAAAISVLTEPFYFKGDDRYLREISEAVTVPLLRKDFIVDDYMIYESKLLGAEAVLFICSLLDAKTLAKYISIAHSVGLSALVETHNEEEVKMALAAGSRIIGVNNRNLKTFEVDISLSSRLKALVPCDVLFVAESGINTAEDVDKMRKIGAHAVLIGERFMRVKDKRTAMAELRGTP